MQTRTDHQTAIDMSADTQSSLVVYYEALETEAKRWWIDGDDSRPLDAHYRRLFDNAFDSTAESARYRQRGSRVMLQSAYRALAKGVPFSAGTSSMVLNTGMAKTDWRALVQQPEQAYALIYNMFVLKTFGAEASTWDALNKLLAEWFPETSHKRLTEASTCQDVADKVFDSTWRSLYDIDFDELSWDGLRRVICTQPPLTKNTLTQVTLLVTRPVMLPDNLTPLM